MIALYIIGGILLLILCLLLIPVGAELRFRDEPFVLVRYGGIKVFDSDKNREKADALSKKHKRKSAEENKAKKPKKKNFIAGIFDKYGKITGIKFCFRLIKAAILKMIWVIKRIKFRNLFLDITVSSDNAANTAIAYGEVCAAVYPVINLLDRTTSLTVKKVNVRTDFEKLSPQIEAAISLKTRLIYALIALISLYFSYLKLKKECDKNER
ncbi:MAG: DUF2953 domain-containing protein [Clostridia bacterium]|nr:DUF2953 domain-containing protein [Clostridia bacterium]